MNAQELMFELSHPRRLKTLHLLSQKPHRLTDLSKSLDLTSAEISRHLGRLSDARLLTKDAKGRYSLSHFGNIVLNELSNIEFLTKNIQYFSTHDLTVIPDDLRLLSAISECRFVEGALEIMSMVDDLSRDADRSVHIITDQVMRSMVDINFQKAEEGLEVKIIFQKDIDGLEPFQGKKSKTMEVRLLEEVNLGLKFNEKTAGMALPDLNGKVDFNSAMISEKSKFLEWAGLLFDYYWQKASPMV